MLLLFICWWKKYSYTLSWFKVDSVTTRYVLRVMVNTRKVYVNKGLEFPLPFPQGVIKKPSSTGDIWQLYSDLGVASLKLICFPKKTCLNIFWKSPPQWWLASYFDPGRMEFWAKLDVLFTLNSFARYCSIYCTNVQSFFKVKRTSGTEGLTSSFVYLTIDVTTDAEVSLRYHCRHHSEESLLHSDD